jgi:hypothetical protein
MVKERKATSAETVNLKPREESEVKVTLANDIETQKRRAESERFAKDLYENLKKSLDIWRSAGLKFKRVADLVLVEVDKDEDGRSASQKPPIDDIYIFLMSVAIENILKGLLIARGRSYEEVTVNHNIAKLYEDYCELFGVPVTDDEGLFSVLTHAAMWVGRFNLPRSSKQLANAFERHGLNIGHMGYGLSVSLLLSKDTSAEPGELKAAREKINVLYERLYAHFLTVSGSNGT